MTDTRKSLPWVLLPGWGMNAATLQPLAEALQQSSETPLPRQVICLNWPEDPALWQQAADGDLLPLLQAIHQLHPEPAVWLGWSLGGLLLGQLLQRPHFKASIPAAVFLGCGPRFVAKNKTEASWGLRATELLAFKKSWRRDPTLTWQSFLTWQCLGELNPQASTVWFQTQTDHAGLYHSGLSQQVLQAGLELLQQLDHSQLLQESDSPLLLIRGEDDPLCPDWQTLPEDFAHASIQWQQLAGCGHAAHHTEPELLAQALMNWRAGFLPEWCS